MPQALSAALVTLARKAVDKVVHVSSEIISSVARVISAAATLAFYILAAKILGAIEYGKFIVFMTFVGFASVGVSLGAPMLIERDVARMRGSGETTYLLPLAQWQFGIAIILGLVIWVAWMFGSVDLVLGTTVLIAMWVCGNAGAVVCGYEHVLFFSLMNSVVRPAIALLVFWLFGFYWIHDKNAAIVAQFVAAAAVSIAFLIKISCEHFRKVSPLLQASLSAPLWSDKHRQMLFSAVTFGSMQLVINLTTQVDIIILNWIGRPEQVAQYHAAARGANVVSFFYAATLALSGPAITRMIASKEFSLASRKILDTAHKAALLTLAAAIFGALVGRRYLAFFGTAFSAAFVPLLLLLAVFAIVGFTGPAQQVLLAYRKERWVLALAGISLVADAATSVALIPRFGVLGAALGTSVQMLVFYGGQAVAAYSVLGIRSDAFRLREAPAVDALP